MHRLKNMFVFLCAGSEQILYDSGTRKYKHVLLPVCDAVDECKSVYRIIGNCKMQKRGNLDIICYNHMYDYVVKHIDTVEQSGDMSSYILKRF